MRRQHSTAPKCVSIIMYCTAAKYFIHFHICLHTYRVLLYLTHLQVLVDLTREGVVSVKQEKTSCTGQKWWVPPPIQLTDWLTDLLTHWLTHWFTDSLTDWLTDWLTDSLPDWLTDWLTHWLTHCLTHCLTDSLTDWLTHWLADNARARSDLWQAQIMLTSRAILILNH